MKNLHDLIISQGPVMLQGSVSISGSKNASLPLLAATLLCKGPITFKNLPHLVDIGILTALLHSIGSDVTWINGGIVLNHKKNNSLYLDPLLANKIRGSVLLLGPLLARYGEITLPMPGGCPIGKRPIDFHLQALEQLGATFVTYPDRVHGLAKHGLKGSLIRFPKPTVTGTENIIMAACLAKGSTIIENAACDNEVDELIRFLTLAGAKIERQESTIIIDGNDDLLELSNPFTIIADRMEAGSFLAACGMTHGSIDLNYTACPGLEAILEHLVMMGMNITLKEHGLSATVTKPLRARSFVTAAHPGFPTDLQAPFMALNCVSNGLSSVQERIWENRFFHAEEFLKMGAVLTINKTQVNCDGHRNLHGALVQAQDLRGSCALLLMSLVAQGTTIIEKNHHLDRGYEFIINKLNKLGAHITRQFYNDNELIEHSFKSASLIA